MSLRKGNENGKQTLIRQNVEGKERSQRGQNTKTYKKVNLQMDKAIIISLASI